MEFGLVAIGGHGPPVAESVEETGFEDLGIQLQPAPRLARSVPAALQAVRRVEALEAEDVLSRWCHRRIDGGWDVGEHDRSWHDTAALRNGMTGCQLGDRGCDHGRAGKRVETDLCCDRIVDASILRESGDDCIDLGFVALVLRYCSPPVDHLLGGCGRAVEPREQRGVRVARRDHGACLDNRAIVETDPTNLKCVTENRTHTTGGSGGATSSLVGAQ